MSRWYGGHGGLPRIGACRASYGEFSKRLQWAGWRSNPRLHLFRVALDRLSYRPVNGKARCRVTPGIAGDDPEGNRPGVNSGGGVPAAGSRTRR